MIQQDTQKRPYTAYRYILHKNGKSPAMYINPENTLSAVDIAKEFASFLRTKDIVPNSDISTFLFVDENMAGINFRYHGESRACFYVRTKDDGSTLEISPSTDLIMFPGLMGKHSVKQVYHEFTLYLDEQRRKNQLGQNEYQATPQIGVQGQFPYHVDIKSMEGLPIDLENMYSYIAYTLAQDLGLEGRLVQDQASPGALILNNSEVVVFSPGLTNVQTDYVMVNALVDHFEARGVRKGRVVHALEQLAKKIDSKEMEVDRSRKRHFGSGFFELIGADD